MIDIEKIKEYTGADEAFIALLFNKFLGHLDSDLEVLRSQAEVENWPNVRNKTHAMLSSARIFHLDPIIALSMEIEAKVDQNELDGLTEMTQRLIVAYKDLRTEVEKWIASISS